MILIEKLFLNALGESENSPKSIHSRMWNDIRKMKLFVFSFPAGFLESLCLTWGGANGRIYHLELHQNHLTSWNLRILGETVEAFAWFSNKIGALRDTPAYLGKLRFPGENPSRYRPDPGVEQYPLGVYPMCLRVYLEHSERSMTCKASS
jgi:hypothetical protein